MSVEVVSSVFQGSGSRGVDRLVLLVLAQAADRSGIGRTDIAAIAAAANCSERRALTAVTGLQGLGELRVTRTVEPGFLYCVTAAAS